MKKVVLSILLLFVGNCVSMVEQEVPTDLAELFTDSTLRQQVEQQFNMPLDLHTRLQSIISNPHNAQLLELAHKYSREQLSQNWKRFLKDSEFKPVAVGPTLILEHNAIPDYLIEVPLVKDHQPNNINEYQNVSRIPNWLVARNALQATESIENGFDKKIALPEQMYFWDIRDITCPTQDSGEKLSDRNFLILTHKVNLVPEKEKAQYWHNMSENQKQAIKYLIINGKLWDISQNNINFTPDGRFAYLDTEQPNNSQRENFFAKSLSKELWNAHAGLASLDQLLGYDFAKADDEAILSMRNALMAQQS